MNGENPISLTFNGIIFKEFCAFSNYYFVFVTLQLITNSKKCI